jgi:hypothetical protein
MEYLERNRHAKTLQRMLLNGMVFGSMIAILAVIAWIGLSNVTMDISHMLPQAPTMVQ